MLALNFVNQAVVGALGATAIAAVGFANSLTMILLLTLSALGASVSILVARSHGGGRRGELDRTVSAAMLLAAIITTVAAAVPFVWPAELLEFTGASAGVTAVGTDYLRVASLSLLPAVLGAVLSGVMRSLGQARRPMVATLITVLANTVLGYALVFGVGPFPQLGVVGAAWATLITTMAKLAILLFQLYGRHGLARWEYPRGWAKDKSVLWPLVVLAVPLGITELFWTTGTFLYNVVVAQLGDDALAAAQIVNTLEAVFVVGSIGLMSATTALVGRSVGGGDAPGAVAWTRRVTRAGVHTGGWFGLLFAASAMLLGVLFGNVGADVRTAATIGIVINAAFQIVKVRNMIIGAGVLPSAGDTRGVILGDVVSAFVIGLPLAILLGLHTPLGIVGVFLARVIEETVKLGVFTWRARRIRWEKLTLQQRGPHETY